MEDGVKSVGEIIETHKDVFKNMFDKFQIKAPPTKENVLNAIKGIPSFKNAVLNTFSEEFNGGEESPDNYVTETDALTGEEKKVRRKKIAKDVFGFVKDAASAAIKTKVSGGGNDQPVYEEPTKNEATGKDGKKIFGMSPIVFGSTCVIFALIVILLIIKFKK